MKRALRGIWAFLLACVTASSLAAPQSGWWWNPNEAGRGYFIEIVDDWIFVSGYFYSSDGRATWMVSNDPMPQANFYEGRLLSLTGGQTLVGDYRAPSAPVVEGMLRLEFSDDTHAAMTWPGGRVAIERYNFRSAAPNTFQPETGWYWNPSESGRGFSVELQGQHMFIGAYMYDTDGRPVWYVADAMMTTPRRFVAPLLQFANGQTMGGTYRAPGPPAVVGTLTFDFSSADRATVTLDEEGPKRVKIIEVRKQKEKSLPEFFDGRFTQTIDFSPTATFFVEVEGLLTWKRMGPNEEVVPLDGGTGYWIQLGEATTRVVGTIDRGDQICSVSASERTMLRSTDGLISIQRDGRYSGNLGFSVTLQARPCDMPFNIPVEVTVRMSGTMQPGWELRGAPPVPPGTPAVATRWSFFGRN